MSAANASNRPQAILDFWFAQSASSSQNHYRKVWFIKDPAFDSQIRERFLLDVEKASVGEYETWATDPQPALGSASGSAVALLLLLDQFPRNLYRDSAKSFATDPQALQVAKSIVETGTDKTLPPAYRFFVYVPFEHSEVLADQNRCVALMQQLNADIPNLDDGLKGGLDYAIRHRDVIEQFGRFPHRNEILGRQSTPEEIAFLQQPGSRF